MSFEDKTLACVECGSDFTFEAAEQEFRDPGKRNAFFAAVGALPPLTTPLADALRAAGSEKAFNEINDSVRAGAWTI